MNQLQVLDDGLRQALERILFCSVTERSYQVTIWFPWIPYHSSSTCIHYSTKSKTDSNIFDPVSKFPITAVHSSPHHNLSRNCQLCQGYYANVVIGNLME